jgi:hypothetical protein
MFAYLYTVIPIRIAEQLLKPCAVEKFFDEKFPRAVLSNTNALATIG